MSAFSREQLAKGVLSVKAEFILAKEEGIFHD